MIPGMARKKRYLGFLTALSGVLLLLSACEPGHPVGEDPYWGSSDVPDHFTWLGLGRALSGGKVDIYDPSATFFNVIAPDLVKTGPDFPLFAPDIDYVPMDDDVVFFALTRPGDDLVVVDPTPVFDPVPLE
jgi:hypothetical protein